jgi:hypothetical protein
MEAAMSTLELKRQYARMNYDADVMFSINYNAYFGEIKDISLGGAFISLDNLPAMEPDDEVRITIPYCFQNKDITLRGRVTRYAENGVGIEFF